MHCGKKQTHFYFQRNALWNTSKCRSETPFLVQHLPKRLKSFFAFEEACDAAESHEDLLWQSQYPLGHWGAFLFCAVNHQMYFKLCFCWWRSGGFWIWWDVEGTRVGDSPPGKGLVRAQGGLVVWTWAPSLVSCWQTHSEGPWPWHQPTFGWLRNLQGSFSGITSLVLDPPQKQV